MNQWPHCLIAWESISCTDMRCATNVPEILDDGFMLSPSGQNHVAAPLLLSLVISMTDEE